MTKHFKIGGNFSRKTLHAVDDANIVINRQEIVALAGESGSGKSTIARLLARIYKPTSGEIYYQGKPLSSMHTRRDSLGYRSDVPMVFQDPFSSLNPAYRVNHGIMRGLEAAPTRPHVARRSATPRRSVSSMLSGLTPAADILQRYPYELSGGQRQRIGFAQALAYRPKLILADEPVSMLDVSIRIGLLNVMAKLRQEAQVSFLYITHDIASARYVADRIMIMYAGNVVESGPAEAVLANPKHPYTQLLLSAVPDPRAPLAVGAETDKGEPPKVIDPTPGCRFRERCPLVIDVCHHVDPQLRLLAPRHTAACHVAKPDADFLAPAREVSSS